jgi:hypothetical protein
MIPHTLVLKPGLVVHRDGAHPRTSTGAMAAALLTG